MEDQLKQLQTTEGELSRLVQWFEAAEDGSREARATSEQCRDYYDGKQYTSEELDTLKKRKQPVITVNRIKPKINTLKGMESKSRTNPKALPRNVGFDDEAAESCQDAIRFVLDSNEGDRLFSECFDNLVIEGTEAVEVNVEPVPESEDFKITLRQIHWDRQFTDQHSRERSYSDAKYCGEVIWLDRDDAVAEYPDSEAIITATMDKFGGKVGETYNDKPQHRWVDGKRQRVCLISICYRKGADWMHAVFVRGGFLQEPEKVPFVDEDGNSEPLYIYQSAYVDRDGNRYGMVKDWLSQQDEINKRRSKALHLMSVRQSKVRKGAVDSISVLRAELAKPDGVIQENIEDGVTLLPTGDMAQAQFQLLQEAKNEIDAVGVNAAMAGAETRVMSGRALEARANAGSAEVQPILDAHAQFKNRVYRAIWNRIRQYWTAQKWVRVTDNEKNIKFVGLNQPVTMLDKLLEQAKARGQQVDPQMLEQLKQDPEMQVIVGQKNVPASIDVDIILDEVPDFAALQSEQFAQLSEMAGKGMPIPPEALIQASSLRDKDKILKMMRGETDDDQPGPQQFQQLQQQMEQMDQAIQGMSEEMQQKEEEARAAQLKLEQETSKRLKLEIELDRTKAIDEIQAAQRDLQGAMNPGARTSTSAAAPVQSHSLRITTADGEMVTQEVQMLADSLAQMMTMQSEGQRAMAEQIVQALAMSTQQTQQSIQEMAQMLLAERQQPKTIRLPSGKVLEVNPASGEITQIQ